MPAVQPVPPKPGSCNVKIYILKKLINLDYLSVHGYAKYNKVQNIPSLSYNSIQLNIFSHVGSVFKISKFLRFVLLNCL